MLSKTQIRKSVHNVLSLLSSKQQQIDFQQNSPSVNVALEILCLWFDELYNPGTPLFQKSFTKLEFDLLQEFNQYYSLRKGKLPESLNDLHDDADWKIIMHEAKSILDTIIW